MSAGDPSAASNSAGNAATTPLEVDPQWAWAPYAPSSATPWGLPLAAHLLRRAGFGGTWTELQEACARGPQATIDALLRQPAAYESVARQFDEDESAAARSGDGTMYVAWWLRRLRQSPWPLLEKLTLFWHGYFAVRLPDTDRTLLQPHVQLLRQHAFAEFPKLLQAMSDDPAMYAGLGGEQNRKSRPNFHFARQWLEAFTIGPDAANAFAATNLARAWTGWFLYGGKLRFIEREHDDTPKSLLGKERNWGRDDALCLLAEDPATATHLSRRLFRAFVSESAPPPDSLLAPIAARIAAKAPMLDVLEMILRSNLFFSAHAVAQRIKSPVELAIGLLRSLEGGMPTSAVAQDLANLGQRLDLPPTVQGWTGGTDWLNTITIAARSRLCASLVRGSELYGTGLHPEKIAAANAFTAPDRQARFLIDLLLPGLLPNGTAEGLVAANSGTSKSAQALLEMIIAQPEFQLN